MIQEEYDLLIIGGGLSALFLAQTLTKSTINYKIVEKSIGVGGRAATRRVGTQKIDHGAQYFTCATEEFRDWTNANAEWLNITEWQGSFKTWDGKALETLSDNVKRYCSPEGMTQISKKLAAVLPLSKEERIISTGRLENGRWALASSQEKLYVAKKVISTAPQPQSIELFAPHLTADELLELGEVRFEPCLSLILLYPIDHSPAWSGIFWNHGKIISWVAHDSSKRKDPQYCCLVVQCQPEFSEKYFEADPQKILKKVLFELHVAFGDHFQKPIEYHCKTWKYSRCSNSLGKNYFVNYDESLFMTGDWCLGNKIESAFTSANKLSEYAVFQGKTPKLKI